MERRISLRGQMKFPVVETDGTYSVLSQATDVSATGIQLVCYEKPPSGAREAVQLELHLPGLKRPIKVKARRVWSDGYRQGMSFVELDDADRLELAEAIDRLKGRQALAS